MSWFIKIDGVTLPTPISAPITEFDIYSPSTGRAESGFLSGERVRSNIGTIDLTWKHLTPEEAQLLRNALSPAAFTVAFRFLGDTSVWRMYAGDREFEPDFTDGGKTERWNLSVKLTQF